MIGSHSLDVVILVICSGLQTDNLELPTVAADKGQLSRRVDENVIEELGGASYALKQ